MASGKKLLTNDAIKQITGYSSRQIFRMVRLTPEQISLLPISEVGRQHVALIRLRRMAHSVSDTSPALRRKIHRLLGLLPAQSFQER